MPEIGTTLTPGTGTGTGTPDALTETQRRIAEAQRVQATVDGLEDILTQLSSRGGLTAEDLIAQTETNVGEIDAQIGQVMAAMNARARSGERLRAVTANYQDHLRLHPGDAYDLDQNITLANGTTMSRRAALEEAGCTDVAVRFGTTIVSTESEAFKTMLEEQSATITEGSEVATLRLQSLVSQRNQALQMTSQLIAAMNETNKGILGHIGR